MPHLGIHTFTAGSLEKAALKAAELGANTFQIFSASPRMWRARLPDPVQVKLLQAARERFDLLPLAHPRELSDQPGFTRYGDPPQID
jgi:deoxyribonuclease-4